MSSKSFPVASAVLSIVCTVSLTACGGGGESTSRSTYAPNGESLTVQALDNSFRPVEYEISAGTAVVFENRGRNDHNILPDFVANDGEMAAYLAGEEPSAWGVVSADFAPGDTYTHVFAVSGTYTFYCSIHGSPGAGMYGTLVVTEPVRN